MASLGHRQIMCEYTFRRVLAFRRVLLLYHHLLMNQVRNINLRVLLRLLWRYHPLRLHIRNLPLRLVLRHLQVHLLSQPLQLWLQQGLLLPMS